MPPSEPQPLVAHEESSPQSAAAATPAQSQELDEALLLNKELAVMLSKKEQEAENLFIEVQTVRDELQAKEKDLVKYKAEDSHRGGGSAVKLEVKDETQRHEVTKGTKGDREGREKA